ncbi:MAG TPA: endonuclease III [Polyangiaceae bacterium]|nr:endonuclease III [Polyangiaceae bacterium]
MASAKPGASRRIVSDDVVSKSPSAVHAKRKAELERGESALSKASARSSVKAGGPEAKPNPRGASKALAPQAALAVFEKLRTHHADAHCELDHQNPFQLLVATVLSAQSTDVMVNKITPDLFRRFPTPESLAQAKYEDVEAALNRIGMFRQKAKNIIGLSKGLVEKHGGEVPRTLAELIELPGVGRKTANVVLGVAFGAPEGVVVDTHVQRLSQRLGFTRETEPPEIEQALMQLFPRADWEPLPHVLIFHGRRICSAIKPACAACPVQGDCPSAFHAENVGRKAPRVR